jgi:hypothetical protein
MVLDILYFSLLDFVMSELNICLGTLVNRSGFSFFRCRFSAELRKILSLNCLPEKEAFRIYDVNFRAGKKNVLVFTYN